MGFRSAIRVPVLIRVEGVWRARTGRSSGAIAFRQGDTAWMELTVSQSQPGRLLLTLLWQSSERSN